MNVTITSFVSPFSFFCLNSTDTVVNTNIIIPNESLSGKQADIVTSLDFAGLSHGQYVAILWNNKWARGIVTLQNNLMIWLVDHGTYVRPDHTTVYVILPPEHKKYPTKVFEASIHGVIPIDKAINMMCEIEDVPSTKWNSGTTEKVHKLLGEATNCIFYPLAILSTKENDVVLGDLYLKLKDNTIVNLVDALEQWPVFLERNTQAYVTNMPAFYTSRRMHRSCRMMPALPKTLPSLPTISSHITFGEYNAICRPAFKSNDNSSSDSDEGSTCTYIKSPRKKNISPLTPAEIVKYSQQYIMLGGKKHNMLNLLTNKARDLEICEMYKDVKYIGRANSRKRNGNHS